MIAKIWKYCRPAIKSKKNYLKLMRDCPEELTHVKLISSTKMNFALETKIRLLKRTAVDVTSNSRIEMCSKLCGQRLGCSVTLYLQILVMRSVLNSEIVFVLWQLDKSQVVLNTESLPFDIAWRTSL
jgi:hypothetical protein